MNPLTTGPDITIAEKLQAIIDSKNSISAAIISKGGTVPHELSGYGPAIEALPSGQLGAEYTVAQFDGDILSSYILSKSSLDSSDIVLSRISHIKTGSNTTSVANEAFGNFTAGSTSLLSFEGPYLNSIGQAVFQKCANLSSIVLSNNLTGIGINSFSNTGSNTTLTVVFNGKTMSEVQAMDDYPWSALSGSNYVCSDGTIVITGPSENETTRFYYTNGTYADIDIVGEVPEYAYKNNSTITKVEFGTHVTSVGKEAFQSCSKLSAVEFSSTITEIKGDGFNTSKIVDLVIPGNIKTIGDGAFRGISTLRSAVLEEGVENCIKSTFYNGTSLSSVILPSTIQNIGIEFAWNCQNLQTLYLPEQNSLSSIGNDAFRQCYNMNSLTFPSSLVSIGTNAFSSYGSTSGANITFEGKTMAQVQAMANYPWGARSGIKFFCSDGTITR